MATQDIQATNGDMQVQNATEQVCTIQIACVVPSDDAAMSLKKRLTEALSGLTKKRFAFTLTDGNIPTNPRMPG